METIETLTLPPTPEINLKDNCFTTEAINNFMTWYFDTPIIIQGITESEVADYIQAMKACGTEIVAGISCGYQDKAIAEVPIFNLVEDAVKAIGQIKTSLIFVPPYEVLDASLEAIASGIEQLIVITPHVPPLDAVKLLQVAKKQNIFLLGFGSAGIIIPEKLSLGTLQSQYFVSGEAAIIGYDKALIYEVAWILNEAGIGQSIAISLGQDKLISESLVSWLKILDEDEATKVIILIQSGQDIDYQSLELLSESTTKPVICYIYGLQSPADKVFREGLDIVKNYLSNSIPATNSLKKITTIVKKSGAIIANKPSEITQIINKLNNKKTKKNSK